jgi:ABC-type antimicrobial peptide transport system permease subunit
MSVALTRVIQAGLLGVAEGDPRVLLAFATVLILTALAAAYFPARRAASLDPNTALRVQ